MKTYQIRFLKLSGVDNSDKDKTSMMEINDSHLEVGDVIEIVKEYD